MGLTSRGNANLLHLETSRLATSINIHVAYRNITLAPPISLEPVGVVLLHGADYPIIGWAIGERLGDFAVEALHLLVSRR